MYTNFKDEIKGERIVLRINKPEITLAKNVFKTIDENREHLKPWFIWVDLTLKVEDTLKYFFDINQKLLDGNKVEYGIFLNDVFIGNIALFDFNDKNKSAEIGYWLSEKHTRKGYMTEAVKLLEKEGFENLNLNRILLKCDEKNIASTGVAKKNNYVLEGTLRKDVWSDYFNNFRNSLYFSKLKEEWLKEQNKC